MAAEQSDNAFVQWGGAGLRPSKENGRHAGMRNTT